MDDHNDLKSIRHNKSSTNHCSDNESNTIPYVKRSEQYYLSLLVHLDNIHKVIHHKQDNNDDDDMNTAAVLQGSTTVITNPVLDLHSNLKTTITTPTSAPVNEMKKLIQKNNFLNLRHQSERMDREKRNLQRQQQRLDNYNEIITKTQKMTPKSMMLDMIPRDNLTMNER